MARPPQSLPLFLLLFPLLCYSHPSPLNCTDPSRLCTSFIAFRNSLDLPLPEILSMFDATAAEVTADPESSPNYLFIKKNCSCLTSRSYFTNTTFTVRRRPGGNAFAMVSQAYDGLASYPNSSRWAREGAVVSLRLYCGCSSGLWNYLMSYVMEERDSVESLSSRFGVSMDSIETVNGMDGPDGVVAGDVYYIPLNSVPGQPYVDTEVSPAVVPAPAPTFSVISESPDNHSRKFPYGWVIGSMGIAIILIAVTFLSCISCKAMNCFSHVSRNQSKDPDQPASHKFHILKSSSFCYTSGRFLCCKSGHSKPPVMDATNRHINIPKAVVGDAFDMEKPIVFTHAEILSSTDYFSDSNLLGHGTYGSVYYGVLRDQEVAIKRMTATKTREFMAEMKVLCKVHHASLS